ncbi:zinc finger DNA-binding protein [Colletotrichum truncatum]|uniref:Zinc finger DNA-binding protein n=1 Tax=Colletotrichum truncatum TaxID=5467 RepID=A0ACC3YX35_COLTU
MTSKYNKTDSAHPPNQGKRGLFQSMHNPQNDGVPAKDNWPGVPWPEHFIIRKGVNQSTLVPLIPVDLLPSYVEIVGLPRDMTIRETVGMSNLGEFTKPPGHFQLHFMSPSEYQYGNRVCEDKDPLATIMVQSEEEQKPLAVKCPSSPGIAHYIVPTATVKTGQPAQAPTRAPPPVIPLPPRRVLDWADDTESASTEDFSGAEYSSASTNENSSKRRPDLQMEKNTATGSEKDCMGQTATATAVYHPTLNRSASAPVATPAQINANYSSDNTAGNKKGVKAGKPKASRPAGSLCRHWCQTGQCSFGRDCRYTHQMPITLEGLVDVGLAELPAWWRKAAGLPVAGTIDVRIFSATYPSATAVVVEGGRSGKKSPSIASTGASMMIATQQSKKARMRVEKERKMAEEVHSVRLQVEKAQATASSVTVEKENGKRRIDPVFMHMKGESARQQAVIEKLVDI